MANPLYHYTASGVGSGLSPVSLETIRGMNELQIREKLKSNVAVCVSLFREACRQQDVISQVKLSQVYVQIISPGIFHRREDAFSRIYKQAINYECPPQIIQQTFQQAISLGYTPLFLDCKIREWGSAPRTICFGFAFEIYPYVGKDTLLTSYFSYVVRRSARVRSKRHLHALYWMWKSGQFNVTYPGKEIPRAACQIEPCSEDPFVVKAQAHGNLVKEYIARHSSGASSAAALSLAESLHMIAGGLFIYEEATFSPPTIIADSLERWEDYVRSTLQPFEVESLNSASYSFSKHNFLQIGQLLKTYDLTLDQKVQGASSIGDRNSFVIKAGVDVVGEIKIDSLENTISQRLYHQTIQPVINFIEDLLENGGMFSSICNWLDHLKSKA